MPFEWHVASDLANQRKHGVAFGFVQQVFLDRRRMVAVDRRRYDEEDEGA